MINNNKLIILLLVLIIIAVVFLSFGYYRLSTSETSTNVIDSSKQTLTTENIEEKISKVFSSWDNVTTAEYKMVSNNGKIYIESNITTDIKNNHYQRINNIVQGMNEGETYVTNVVRKSGVEKAKLSDDTIVNNANTVLGEILDLEAIKSNFNEKLVKFKVEGIDEEIVEEKTDSGLNRIKVKIIDTKEQFLNDDLVYPYELLIEFSDTNEIKLVGVPLGNSYTLFMFNAYNNEVNIEDLN